jgi:two-component system NtrC family sensor kinase
MGASARQDSKSSDHPYFRRIWLRVATTMLLVTFLPMLLIEAGLFHFGVSSGGWGVLAFLGYLALMTATVVLIASDLIARLERKRRSLRALDRQLRQASYLAASMELSQVYFHEVKDTLANIDSIVALLKLDAEAAGLPELMDSVAQINDEVSRGRVSVDRFLRYIQPEPPLIREINLHHLLEDLIDILERSLRFRQITVERDFLADPPTVRSDRSKLRQVFQNVVLNAMNAVAGGGCIAITTRCAGEALWITVEDSGPGIAESDLKYIFEPADTGRKKGIGVGLPICRDILTRLGGRITVDSVLGQGTTVKVVLPRQFIARPAAEPAGADD